MVFRINFLRIKLNYQINLAFKYLNIISVILEAISVRASYFYLEAISSNPFPFLSLSPFLAQPLFLAQRGLSSF
jgi:hypothetical protein